MKCNTFLPNYSLEDFKVQGSGWKLASIEQVAIYCSEHSQITRIFIHPQSSVLPPKSIASHFPISRMKTNSAVSIASLLNRVLQKVCIQSSISSFTLRPFLHELIYTSLTFPLEICQIKKYEIRIHKFPRECSIQ